jgi:hypothetical protein
MPSQRDAVIAAAEARATALATADAATLRRLLHPSFRWTSFIGEVFDRDSYIASNTTGALVWRAQRLEDVEVVVVGTTAVLVGAVVDEVERDGAAETFRLRVTQVWVRDTEWCCLGGHAGPRLDSPAGG